MNEPYCNKEKAGMSESTKTRCFCCFCCVCCLRCCCCCRGKAVEDNEEEEWVWPGDLAV